jgi:hypothetical protein
MTWEETLQLVISAIGAIAALGLAAMSLVDSSKAFWGGIANVGFGHIERACLPFRTVLRRATGEDDWRMLLRAQWRNGRNKDDQKAVVRSLVRLGITEGEVRELAAIANVDPARLAKVSQRLQNGDEISDVELRILGRIDAVIGMRIDAAFERADQQYRNVARACAGLVAIMLAIGVALLDPDLTREGLLYALVAGVLAVPIAPIAKDLVSALGASMQAVKAARSGR